MGYLMKAILGAALFFGGVALFNVKLVQLLETGTCASGNVPYEIAPGYQCPDDTGTNILLMVAGIFGGLIGAGLYAFRGNPPWGSGRRGFSGMFGAGTFAWGFFFTATGATSLYASLTNDAIQNSNGGELGGIIVGGTFLVMGVPALLIALAGLLKGLRGRDERPPAMTATAGGFGGGGVMSRMSAGLDQARSAQQLTSRLPWGSSPPSGGGGTSGQIAKLERLQKLRESGALTDAEFEREKAKILAE
jgi:putative oligomerization/nucleic acid binding protein